MIQRIALLLAFVLLAGCGGSLVVNQGADFAAADDPSAPPLPTDYAWGQPKKEDLDHDGHVDLAYYAPDGSLQGAGFDENRDGKVDVLRKYDHNGKVVEEIRDTDHNGALDQRATDTDGDGTLDKVTPYPPK